MQDQIMSFATRYGIDPERLFLAGLGVGVAFLFFSLVLALGRRNPAAVRIAQGNSHRADTRFNRGLLRETSVDPRGLMRAAMPTSAKDVAKLEEKFLQAGITSPTAMRSYILTRIAVGLVLPVLFLVVAFGAQMPGVPVPDAISGRFEAMGHWNIVRVVLVLVALGYYLPAAWLNSRVSQRKQRISDAFPNALDLLQISLEAGLGFDAAMTRVGNELAKAAPDIAFEFLSAQHQIQAGRPRREALDEMARRTGLDTIRSFASVVHQSIEFGTSMTEALATYAAEMRLHRELRAQELANKLPVKMSAVLATLMLPALVMVTIGPVVIRYIRFFAG